MRRFGAAAILAALCSALCLPGSGGKRRRLQYAARNKLNDTFDPRTMGSWLFFLLGVRGEDLGIADLSGCRRSGRRSFSSSHNDSDSIAECVSNKVKQQHDNTYHGVKTLARRLCSIRARSFTSPHIRAPLPLHCLCDSERAASMGCGQHTSIDLPKSVILRCPGASFCSAQLGATRTLGEPLQQRNCITRGSAHGATDPASSPRGVLPLGQQTPPSRRCTLWLQAHEVLAAAPPKCTPDGPAGRQCNKTTYQVPQITSR